MLNNIFDFFVDFSSNIFKFFEFLFFESFAFTLNGVSYTIIPIGFLIGGIALTIGFLRRIL